MRRLEIAAITWVVMAVGFTVVSASASSNKRTSEEPLQVTSVYSIKQALHSGARQAKSKRLARKYSNSHRRARLHTPRLRVFSAGRPVQQRGGIYAVGIPYVIGGRTYIPHLDPNYRAEGKASWYGSGFHGQLTASGEKFDMNALSAAHPTLPLQSYVRVTNLENRKSVVVRVNDRGPYHANRLIDVSVRAAEILDFREQGIAQVRVEYIGRAEQAVPTNTKLAGSLRR